MKLNFKISELIHSDKAIQNNINNMPDINSLDNMLVLIVECLQPIRNLVGLPMKISSGYRNKEVNKLVGGKATSQHLKGEAVDFNIKGWSAKETFDYIRKSKFQYDQLILERDQQGKEWVHISYRKNKNRKQVLTIQK